MIVFGPVPSRRLGRSLGVNNIPPKACSYSCVYCQVGETMRKETEPRTFFAPKDLAAAVRERLARLKDSDEPVDFITFVPDGEPTLDVHLGDAIELVRPLGLPVAVITNASLLWQAEVRLRLARADWVSLKVDAADEETWRAVNRPAEDLRLDAVHDGMRAFADAYTGFLATETMLIAGLNDRDAQVRASADWVALLKPEVAFVGVPTRPTAAPGLRGPGPESYARAFRAFEGRVPVVEELTGDAEGVVGFAGNAEGDLLATTAVHPMNEADVAAFLTKAHAPAGLADDMVSRGLLKKVRHDGRTFYVRRHEATP